MILSRGSLGFGEAYMAGLCRKLELAPGERLLDIGCGWGGLARFAAIHYGVEVAGITISREQQKLARERCAGLPVSIELMDYRDLTGSYDKVVTVGMFEHVGPKNYPDYFDVVGRVLKDDGLFLLHTIGSYTTSLTVDPWIEKYIFPNGKLPSARQMTSVLEGRLLIEDWHNFGPDYDRTLMACGTTSSAHGRGSRASTANASTGCGSIISCVAQDSSGPGRVSSGSWC
jgi:cyclopropane-fatty-acyl-phospholipid synthase